ncbi:hypothetical protein BJ741DRAFT_588912 [Chytriomyces cf. hyalinus JEL632]|nr:hypothetical protein BJ741DRAFT_588912 [Chytriomyces cf. hyalinus JEL632]
MEIAALIDNASYKTDQLAIPLPQQRDTPRLPSFVQAFGQWASHPTLSATTASTTTEHQAIHQVRRASISEPSRAPFARPLGHQAAAIAARRNSLPSKFMSSSTGTSYHAPLEVIPKFECATCFRRFKRKHHLKSHEALHNVVKSFTCSVATCGQTYRKPHELRQHQLSRNH